MKSLSIILISFTLFLIACQTNAEEIRTLNEKVIEISEVKTTVNPTPTPELKSNDLNFRIGIVDEGQENICIRTKNGNLTKNTPVSIITSLDESPQKILSAKVENKLEDSCSRRASESTDKNPGENFYYSLTLIEKEVDKYQYVFGIGVIEPDKPFQTQNNLVSIDLNNDGKAEFFRSCTSYEGVLFAIWTGKPLKGKQIWHSLYYLDYDTEPDCKKKDGFGKND